MFTKQKTDWALLAKYLAGETGAGENEALEEWLNHSPENRALYRKLKSDWKIMDNMNKQFNVDNAWNKLHGRITAHDDFTGTQGGEKVQMPHRKIGLPFVRIAASLFLLVMLGTTWVFVNGRYQKVTVTTTSNERQKIVTLPDGSKVYLNANTRLGYAKRFNQKSREVNLSGEAFFEVTPDKSRPFYIHANNADIRVVGTSFNIDTRNKIQGAEVYVSTGTVELFQRDNKSNRVLLHPGDLGTMSLNRISCKKSNNENPIAWKTGNMDFQDTRLSEAVEILNEMYRVKIICRESGLDTTKTNGTYHYPQESLDQILAIICQLNNLKVEKSDNIIYLTR